MSEQELLHQIAALHEKVRRNEDELRKGVRYPEVVTSHTEACLEQINDLQQQLAALKRETAHE
jgi:hypothetical protein